MHEEAVLHDVGLLEGDGGARAQGDDVDVHVVADIVGGDEAGCGPGSVGAGHGHGGDGGLVGDEGGRRLEAGYAGVGLADPVEAGGSGSVVAQVPGGAGGQVGVSAGGEGVGLSVADEAGLALDEEEHGLTPRGMTA
ncbi:hypothetical protein ASF58_18175 [Methylobacterium sp. Leaf125]|nr:hypothetical protein ASF58_18175 [Methylobacterium sp. Leaf125]